VANQLAVTFLFWCMTNATAGEPRPLYITTNSHIHCIPNMPSTFTHQFDAPTFKGKVSFNTGIFINGQFVDGSDNTTIEYEIDVSLLTSSC
jgi:hypothetical protein